MFASVDGAIVANATALATVPARPGAPQHALPNDGIERVRLGAEETHGGNANTTVGTNSKKS